MKLFNQGAQTFKHDYTHPTTGEVKQYVSNPNRYVDVPDDLGEKWLKSYPQYFVTDEEAKTRAAASRHEIDVRDKRIAELEAKLALAEKTLDALSKDKLNEALAVVPAHSAIVSEAVANAKRGPGRPPLAKVA